MGMSEITSRITASAEPFRYLAFADQVAHDERADQFQPVLPPLMT